MAKLPFAPTTEDALCAYINWMNYEEHILLIKQHLASLSTFYTRHGVVDPTGNLKVKTLVTEIQNNCSPEAYKANNIPPLTPAHLRKIRSKLNLSSSRERTLWAAIVIGYWSLLRASSLVPTSLAKFDADQHLCMNTMKFHGETLILTVKKTETTKLDTSSLDIPLIAFADNLCPISALCEMWQLCALSETDPLFMYIDALGARRPLLLAEFERLLKTVCTRADLHGEQYALDSLRKGGAAVALLSGGDEALVKAQGDWYPGAYHQYIRYSMEQRVNVLRNVVADTQSWTFERRFDLVVDSLSDYLYLRG